MKIRNLVLSLMAAMVAVPALVSGADSKAAIDGKWNANVESPMGAVQLVLEFKSEGEKLNGTITADMGGGQGLPASPISDGVVKGEDVSFKLSVTMMPDAPAMVIDYKGKLKGDELTLTSTMDMGQGAEQTQLVAKRAK
jgi:hypothetical protein